MFTKTCQFSWLDVSCFCINCSILFFSFHVTFCFQKESIYKQLTDECFEEYRHFHYRMRTLGGLCTETRCPACPKVCILSVYILGYSIWTTHFPYPQAHVYEISETVVVDLTNTQHRGYMNFKWNCWELIPKTVYKNGISPPTLKKKPLLYFSPQKRGKWKKK